jgi:hypothetical protein
MSKQCFDTFGVMFWRMYATAKWRAKHYWAREAPAGAIAHSSRMTNDVLHGRKHESLKLELSNGSQPLSCHTYRNAADECFGEGGIDNALKPKTFFKTNGSAEYAAVIANVFSKQYNAFVSAHFMMEC